MGAEYIELSYLQIALAALLILVNGVISMVLRLGLERSLIVASLRTVVQLLLIGFVLQWVFQVKLWTTVLALLIIMTLVAGVTAVGRAERRYRAIWFDTIISIWTSSWLVTAFGLFVVIQDLEHWYQPQYTIPLLGMVLGNTLNGISLGQNTLTETLAARRDQVEMLLSLGATRWEAARPAVRQSVRTGMTPIINAMLVVGVVSLPGMMTGQILSGAPPLDAVKYQIVIMFLIASATAMGTVSIVLLGYRRLFNADHQFLYQRVQTK
ncbi:MAG: iron export ABC transporter permease subunit FetB [Planctomycetota bacterium]|nr:iron export ABC transporter permease subunit FetB [Planctomycetota bacterium]